MINNPNARGYEILYPLDLVATTLSILGSLCMYFFCLRIPGPLNISTKFILAIATSDLIYSLSNVLSNFETSETHRLCIFEASLRHVMFVLSIFFSSCLAIVSYKISLPRDNMKIRLFYRLAVYIGPAALAFLTILL